MAIVCRTSVPGAEPTYVKVAVPVASVVTVPVVGLAPVTETWTMKSPIAWPSESVRTAVSVSAVPVSSGPGDDSDTVRCPPMGEPRRWVHPDRRGLLAQQLGHAYARRGLGGERGPYETHRLGLRDR